MTLLGGERCFVPKSQLLREGQEPCNRPSSYNRSTDFELKDFFSPPKFALKHQQPVTKLVKHLNKTVLLFHDAAITSRGKALSQSHMLRRWEPGT